MATHPPKQPELPSLDPTLTAGVEGYAFRAKALLDAHDFAGAVREGNRALDVLPHLAELSVVRGRALLSPLLDQLMNTERSWSRDDFKDAWEAFRLALVMDPNSTEAFMELERLGELLKRLPEPEWYKTNPSGTAKEEIDGPYVKPEAGAEPLTKTDIEDISEDSGYDVIIVGAGAAGIGQAFTLTHVFGLDPSRVLLLERGEAVGKSFREWPEEMRFISPSFNQQGWTNSFDLNSVAYGTSPAYTLHAQHPSGEQYANYLSELAMAAKLSIKLSVEVLKVTPVDGGFDVHVRAGAADGVHKGHMEETLRAKYVVWAAGEFQYPRESPATMTGTELCLHNSRVRSWAKLPGDDFVLIGGCAISRTSPEHLPNISPTLNIEHLPLPNISRTPPEHLPNISISHESLPAHLLLWAHTGARATRAHPRFFPRLAP